MFDTPARPAARERGDRRSVEILLATHNSQAFIGPLLDSLFKQSFQDFTLIVAEDRSTDATPGIVRDYCARYPDRLRLVPASGHVRGPMENFSTLMDHATADYVMLCDHDDVWLPDKVRLSVEEMLALEAEHGPETPLLVHTDLIVVDSDLEVLSPSYFGYANVDPHRSNFIKLLTGNVVTGCTSILNRALYSRARPIPREAVMHDHWIALVASCTGVIRYLEQGTLLYRQHGSNVIGARRWNKRALLRRFWQTLVGEDRRRVLRLYSRQAAAILSRFGDQLSAENRRAAAALAELWSISRWRRFVRLSRSGLGLDGLLRNAALLIVVTRSR